MSSHQRVLFWEPGVLHIAMCCGSQLTVLVCQSCGRQFDACLMPAQNLRQLVLFLTMFFGILAMTMCAIQDSVGSRAGTFVMNLFDARHQVLGSEGPLEFCARVANLLNNIRWNRTTVQSVTQTGLQIHLSEIERWERVSLHRPLLPRLSDPAAPAQ